MTEERLKEIKDNIQCQYDFAKFVGEKNFLLDEELELYNEVIRLREIIDETIKYVEEHIKYECDDAFNGKQFYSHHLYDFSKDDLLDILKENK